MYTSFKVKASPYHCHPTPNSDLQWKRRTVASPLCSLSFSPLLIYSLGCLWSS